MEPSGEWYLFLTAFKGTMAGFNECIRSAGVTNFEDNPSDCGIIVTYRDVHDAQWLTFLSLEIDSVKPLNSLRMIRPVEQRVVMMAGARS